MSTQDDTMVTITGSSSIGGFSGSGGAGTTTSYSTIPPITTLSGTTGTVLMGGGGGGGVGATGATAPLGSYYISSSGTGATWAQPNTNILRSGKGKQIDIDELVDIMTIMKERLLILIPAFEKHEKYAALKKAYDNYKMIEALIQEEKKDDK